MSTEKNNDIRQEERSISDILLDPDNCDTITMYDEDSNAVEFAPIAAIPYNDNLFAIMTPIDELDVEEAPGIVFVVKEYEDGSEQLVVVDNEEEAMAVFEIFEKMLEEQE